MRWLCIFFSLGLLGCVPPSPPRCDVRAKFVPQKNITAYELAYIVQHNGHGSMPICFSSALWDELPVNIKRHFQDQEN